MPVRTNLSPALVVGDRYLHLLLRGVTAAVRAGDSNSIDASTAATFPLGSKLHMMIIHDNPVWRCITTSVAKDRFIAGHAERARARWQRAIVRNIVADSHIHHPVVWWPETGWICCRVSDRRWRVRSRRSCCRRVVSCVRIRCKRIHCRRVAYHCAVGAPNSSRWLQRLSSQIGLMARDANVTVWLLPEPPQTPPPVEEHETKVVSAGRLSVTVTDVAASGPLLVTVTV